MLPGFVNGHHHIGLTPVQLGSPDIPLELWFVTRMVMRSVNLYLDTLYSAFEMIASGVTTVQHLHGWLPGKLDQVDRGCDEAIRAYQGAFLHLYHCLYGPACRRARGGLGNLLGKWRAGLWSGAERQGKLERTVFGRKWDQTIFN
jgi:hypothetical protein